MAALLHLPEPQQGCVRVWQARGGYGIICAGQPQVNCQDSCAHHIWRQHTERSQQLRLLQNSGGYQRTMTVGHHARSHPHPHPGVFSRCYKVQCLPPNLGEPSFYTQGTWSIKCFRCPSLWIKNHKWVCLFVCLFALCVLLFSFVIPVFCKTCLMKKLYLPGWLTGLQ